MIFFFGEQQSPHTNILHFWLICQRLWTTVSNEIWTIFVWFLDCGKCFSQSFKMNIGSSLRANKCFLSNFHPCLLANSVYSQTCLQSSEPNSSSLLKRKFEFVLPKITRTSVRIKGVGKSHSYIQMRTVLSRTQTSVCRPEPHPNPTRTFAFGFRVEPQTLGGTKWGLVFEHVWVKSNKCLDLCSVVEWLVLAKSSRLRYTHRREMRE